MRVFHYGKDGGPKSRVWGFFLVEFKSLFSIVLLKFEDGSRDAYHNHAFKAVSWLLRGELREKLWRDEVTNVYRPSWRPILTPRSRFHRVSSRGRSWVLSFRGPWAPTWHEGTRHGFLTKLTHGRKVVNRLRVP